MSYTGIYSVLYKKGSKEKGAKITDWKGFRDYMSEIDFAIFDDLSDRMYLPGGNREGYPRAIVRLDVEDNIHAKLLGFRSWKHMQYYNIERLAWNYCRDDFIEFWSNISIYTEPFWFLHSPEDGGISNLFDLAENDCEEYEIFLVTCEKGEVHVKELKFKLVSEKDTESI